MIKLLFIFISAHVLSASAQLPGPIVGKWNVVAIYDETVYYHITKDSVFVKNADRRAGLSSAGLDSIKAAIQPVFEGLKTAYFIFKKDYTYETFIEGIGKEVGTFTISNTEGMIELKGKEIKEKYNYKIEQHVLTLVPFEEPEAVVLVMEREQ